MWSSWRIPGFLEFNEVNFGPNPNTWFDPYVLFSHKNIHKNNSYQEEFVSMIKTQLNVIKFPDLAKEQMLVVLVDSLN
jgi:hypothetical protein